MEATIKKIDINISASLKVEQKPDKRYRNGYREIKTNIPVILFGMDLVVSMSLEDSVKIRCGDVVTVNEGELYMAVDKEIRGGCANLSLRRVKMVQFKVETLSFSLESTVRIHRIYAIAKEGSR